MEVYVMLLPFRPGVSSSTDVFCLGVVMYAAKSLKLQCLCWLWWGC